jgi:chaperone modulatory protein CbpM
MKKLISANEFCKNHNIGISFIRSLQETGMIEITTIEENGYIHSSQLQELERIVNLYYDLDINLEGIETIRHLLRRINNMQDEITGLRNRLRLYESNEY